MTVQSAAFRALARFPVAVPPPGRIRPDYGAPDTRRGSHRTRRRWPPSGQPTCGYIGLVAVAR
eukprot:2683100-Lingulodinium_polyedra.AAC.1